MVDFRPHPQRDVPAEQWALRLDSEAKGFDEVILELRRQESVWWINHGVGGSEGFWLCSECGERVVPPGETNVRRRGGQKPHRPNCSGIPRQVLIGHQVKADVLRLNIPGLERLGIIGVSWAWSLVYALIQGAIHLYGIDEGDLEGHVLTYRSEEGEEYPLEILLVDPVIGGSGILEAIATHFPSVAQSALEHLKDHDCARSCYRCLRSYRNQRVHGFLDWRLIMPWLRSAAMARSIPLGTSPVSPHVQEGPEWEEARREGCSSPLELRLLKAIRELGLPEPEKQFAIYDSQKRLITVSDFAYPEKNLLIYVDGLAFHSGIRERLHDARVNRRLQYLGWKVLRFSGPEVFRTPHNCAKEIKTFLVASA